MIYDGFVVLDTRDSTGTETSFCGPFGAKSGLYENKPYKTFHEESGDFSVPTTGPTYGPFPNPTYGPNPNPSPPPASPSPFPGLGGGGYSGGGDDSGGSGGGGGYINPQTVAAGTNLISSIFGAISAGKTPEKTNIKAVCGRKPLLNTGGKKDAYFACAERVLHPQAPPAVLPAGMSTSTKVIIGALVAIVLIAIVITIITLMKRSAAKTAAVATA